MLRHMFVLIENVSFSEMIISYYYLVMTTYSATIKGTWMSQATEAYNRGLKVR